MKMEFSGVQWSTHFSNVMMIMIVLWILTEVSLVIMTIGNKRHPWFTFGDLVKESCISVCCLTYWGFKLIKMLWFGRCVFWILFYWSLHSGCLLEDMGLILQLMLIKLGSFLQGRPTIWRYPVYKANASTQLDIFGTISQSIGFLSGLIRLSIFGKYAILLSIQVSTTTWDKYLILILKIDHGKHKWSVLSSLRTKKYVSLINICLTIQ